MSYTADEISVKEREANAKKDCFAFRRLGKCNALNDMYCMYGQKCAFYRKKEGGKDNERHYTDSGKRSRKRTE